MTKINRKKYSKLAGKQEVTVAFHFAQRMVFPCVMFTLLHICYAKELINKMITCMCILVSETGY